MTRQLHIKIPVFAAAIVAGIALHGIVHGHAHDVAAPDAPRAEIHAIGIAAQDHLGIVVTWDPVQDARGNPVVAYGWAIETAEEADTLASGTTEAFADTAVVERPLPGDTLRIVGVARATDDMDATGPAGRSDVLVLHTENIPPPAPTVTVDTVALGELDSLSIAIARADGLEWLGQHGGEFDIDEGEQIQLCAYGFVHGAVAAVSSPDRCPSLGQSLRPLERGWHVAIAP